MNCRVELTSNNEKPEHDERRKKNLVIAYSTFVITFILHLIWTKHDLDFGINNYHLKIIKKRLAGAYYISNEKNG